MKFQVTVARDEDGVWIIECPAIPSCITQGNSDKKYSGSHYTLFRSESGTRIALDNSTIGGDYLMSSLPNLSGRKVQTLKLRLQ